jgi:hypothetical protein
MDSGVYLLAKLSPIHECQLARANCLRSPKSTGLLGWLFLSFDDGVTIILEERISDTATNWITPLILRVCHSVQEGE